MEDAIRFATCADYPPFEYLEKGEFVGFDIDVARLIAKKLNRKATFVNMPFSAIIPALQNESADMGISTLTVTPERCRNVDFSRVYYTGRLAVIHKSGENISEAQLESRKVACQIGSTMQDWVRAHVPSAELVLVDTNNQVVEAIRSELVDVGVMDASQAKTFAAKTGLEWNFLATSDEGYAVAFKQGSPLKALVDEALAELVAEGEIKKTEDKWSLSSSVP
jgi:polar amino acid transport system substrate-binding protein